MKINNNFYIFNTKDGYILHNLDTNEKYLLDSETFKKLANDDAAFEKEFQEAGIVAIDLKKWKMWEYSFAGKQFRNAITLTKEDLNSFNGNEFLEDYLAICETAMHNIQNLESKNFDNSIALPLQREVKADFYELLKKRRTIREFIPESVSLQELADILFISCGKFHESFNEQYLDASNGVCWRRSSPSAGGLNCVEAYVAISRVYGIENGIYFYNSKKHELNLVSKNFKEEYLIDCFLKQDFAINSAFTIFFIANLDLLASKYPHIRSFVFPYLDVGHLAQTAILTATALNLQNWITSAICDEYCMQLLNLKEFQLPLEAVCFGHGINESLGPKIRNKIQELVNKKFKIGAQMLTQKQMEKTKKD